MYAPDLACKCKFSNLALHKFEFWKISKIAAFDSAILLKKLQMGRNELTFDHLYLTISSSRVRMHNFDPCAHTTK